MGLQDLVHSLRVKPQTGRRSLYALTEIGKVKAEEFGVPGKGWKLLSFLDDNGTSSFREICEGLGWKEDEASEIVRRMINSGYVRRVPQQ